MTESSTLIIIMVQVSSALFKDKTVELDGVRVRLEGTTEFIMNKVINVLTECQCKSRKHGNYSVCLIL